MPLFGERQHLFELSAAERKALGSPLHLDEPAGSGHDDVHVDLGASVLAVVEIEQAGPVDDSHRHRATGVGDRMLADVPTGHQAREAVVERDVRAADARSPGSPVGLQDVAVDGDLDLAHRDEIRDGTQ